MKEQPSPFSMSFMDVITCGMGSLVLLFLIQIATSRELEGLKEKSKEGTLSGKVAPFAVVVSGKPSALLWQGDIPRWRIEDRRETLKNLRKSEGRSFAVLLSDRPPSEEARIWIGPFRPGAKVSVHVFLDETRKHHRPAAGPPPGEEWLQIWPLPAADPDEKKS